MLASAKDFISQSTSLGTEAVKVLLEALRALPRDAIILRIADKRNCEVLTDRPCVPAQSGAMPAQRGITGKERVSN